MKRDATWLRLRHHTSLLAAATSPEATSVDHKRAVCKCVFVDCVGFSDVFSSQRNAGLLCNVTLTWKNSDLKKNVSIKSLVVNIYVSYRTV